MAVFTETINCPACGSAHVVKTGKQGEHQRYLCRGCDKVFRAPGIAPGHRVPTEHMGMAIRLFYSGLSYKQIAENMADTFNIPEPSKATLYEWVRDYTDVAHKELKKSQYKAKTGKVWVADEMFVKVGGKTMYHWERHGRQDPFRTGVLREREPRPEGRGGRHGDGVGGSAVAPRGHQDRWVRFSIPTPSIWCSPRPSTLSAKGYGPRSTTTCRSGCRGHTGTARRPCGGWTAGQAGNATLQA